jgi:WD40-like Beta Propeller Repeat
MNADGSGKRRLTRAPRDDFVPAWSPDGRKIAFLSKGDGNQEIHVMKHRRQRAAEPDAQPGGRRLGRLVARADEIGQRLTTVHMNHQRAIVVNGQ